MSISESQIKEMIKRLETDHVFLKIAYDLIQIDLNDIENTLSDDLKHQINDAITGKSKLELLDENLGDYEFSKYVSFLWLSEFLELFL